MNLLDAALASVGPLAHPEVIDIELALLQEKINLFMTGNQIPDGRNRYLESAIARGKDLPARIPAKEAMTRARCMLLLAEALKEMAMVEKEPENHLLRNSEARQYGEAALREIEAMEITDDSKYLKGSTHRHLAVTYELEADSLPDRSLGRSLYEKWQNYSSSAVRLLEEVGETTVRAYAMINIGSSFTRLADFEVNHEKKRSFYDESKRILIDAIPLFRQSEEHRGIGWAYVHLCERGIKEFALTPARGSKSFEELESYANRAIAALKHGADHLALGLAYQFLGVTLYNIVRESGEVGVKLARAIRSLEEGIKQLEKTAYYRGVGDACLWKAQCHVSVWKQSQESSELVAAINELTRGATSTAMAVKAPQFLEGLCQLLDRELRSILSA